MNYCILNGIKSTMIKGLLIQSLPPISKPLMRTSIEEIDGRDGDIVTKLGYSAYDKEMTIGLFGDFDIDQIIKYFNSEGTVIFSNEPDKFYNYQIIGQIDFERLIRFRTATVTFHVQPFKYSAVDDLLVYDKNNLYPKIFSTTAQGIECISDNNLISFEGTALRSIEFYVPIKELNLKAGTYTLKVSASGAIDGKIRLIKDYPSDNFTFGGSDLALSTSATKTATITDSTFNYLWVKFDVGDNVNFTLSASLENDTEHSLDVLNRGNVYSRPKLTIYGSGNITLSINGVQLFTIALGSEEYITLDGLEMNAYKGDDLKNRLVTGDYSTLKLNSGNNVLSWTGNISKIEMENVSRYI